MIPKSEHIPKDKLKQFGLLLGCLLFVSIGYLMVNSDFRSGRYSPESIVFYGYAGIAFFGIIGILIFFNMITSKPALIIDKEGIVNNSHVGGRYLIKWSNIETMKIMVINKQRMIKIDLKDDQEIYSQVNYLSEKWMRLNSRFIGTPTFIPAVMIKMDLEEVLSIMRDQKKLHSKRRISRPKDAADTE